ncbi:MAG: hypothetical protein ABI200_00120 [Gaiellales bacterium]
MPDPTITIVLLALVALLELSPIVRLPVGLVLAIGLLAASAELLPVALIGAIGVVIARVGIALAARSGRDQIGAASPNARAYRETMRARLSNSPAFVRITFLLAALPGISGSFLFPLLGAMRVPLWPALLGTIVGRTPVLLITTAVFTWLGRLGNSTDQEGALTLGVLAGLLLILRSIGLVDWQHRRETGEWRLNDPDARAMQMTTILGGSSTGGQDPFGSSPFGRAPRDLQHMDDDDVIEGELLGEELDDDDDSDDGTGTGRSSLPRAGE